MKTLIKKMSPASSDKTGKKNVSEVLTKCNSYSSSHSVSLNDSLSYDMSKMGLEIDKMGLGLFSPPHNILMELLLPVFCAKIIWFFHIVRKENFKFPVIVLIFSIYHHYVSRHFRYLGTGVFRGYTYLVVPYPVGLGTIRICTV